MYDEPDDALLIADGILPKLSNGLARNATLPCRTQLQHAARNADQK